MLCVNHLTLNDFLGPADDIVHGPYPVPLGAPFQVLGHSLSLGHLSDNEPHSDYLLYGDTPYVRRSEKLCSRFSPFSQHTISKSEQIRNSHYEW